MGEKNNNSKEPAIVCIAKLLLTAFLFAVMPVVILAHVFGGVNAKHEG